MSDAELLEKIKSILKENEDLSILIPVDELKEESVFAADLGLDSLGLMSLVYEIQEDYPDLDESLMADWQTVSDLIKAAQSS